MCDDWIYFVFRVYQTEGDEITGHRSSGMEDTRAVDGKKGYACSIGSTSVDGMILSDHSLSSVLLTSRFTSLSRDIDLLHGERHLPRDKICHELGCDIENHDTDSFAGVDI